MNKARTTLLSLFVVVQLAFVFLSVIAYRTRPQGLIASDGKGYYAWLLTLALDRDFDFANDFDLIYPPDPVPTAPLTPEGRIANKYPVGMAIVEAPGFLAGHAIALGSGVPANGVTGPYQFAVTLWLQLVCLTSLFLLWIAMVRRGADPWISVIAVASALLATNLIQYAARPAMSHAAGLAVICVAIWLAARPDQTLRIRDFAALGALLGLAAIIRPSNVALAPFFGVLLLPRLGRNGGHWAALLVPFAIMMFVQLAVNSALWGRLQFSGYEGEGFTSGLGGVVSTLMSARHGLFVYHPWYLLLLGLCVMAARRDDTRALGLGALASFILLTVVNGLWWSWWFGDSFGNRAFIEIIPALSFPAVLWLSRAANRARMRTAVAASALTLAAANAWLWGGFVLRRFPPDGQHTTSQAWLWAWH